MFASLTDGCFRFWLRKVQSDEQLVNSSPDDGSNMRTEDWDPEGVVAKTVDNTGVNILIISTVNMFWYVGIYV